MNGAGWRGTFVLAVMAVFAVVSPPACNAADKMAAPFVSLRIFHTNDIHGHILPEPDIKSEAVPPPVFGGAASLATAMKQYRKLPAFGRTADVTLYFDAGDFFQGTPEGTLTRGTAMIELFHVLKLDAMGAGNHDFDFGLDTFRKLSDLASWPILALNISEDTVPPSLDRDLFVTDRKTGLRIAVLGWITDDMASVTTEQTRRGLRFVDSLETARREVAAVRDTADFVVAVTHAGLHQDTIIANAVQGLHVIVGGHSHTPLSPYYKSDSTGTVVVQAGGHLRDLGVLDILFNRRTKKIVRANSRLLPLYESEFPPDPSVRAWARRISEKVGRLLDEQVAVSDSNYLKRADTESVPGNLLADAMRWATGADAAFQNSYGIRADIPQGPITLRTLFTIMPFDNTVVSMTLSGEQVMEILEQSAALKRGFLQMSGIRMDADFSRRPGERVVEAVIGDSESAAAVDPGRTYRIATNSFLADGGDLFDTFARGADRRDDGRNMRDVVRDYLKTITGPAGGVFRGRAEGRLRVRGPAPVFDR